MTRPRFASISASLALLILVVSPAFAAGPTFADKPICIVVPFPPGGAVDPIARIVAGHLAQTWSASVIVNNKAGAGGAIGVATVARASATGMTCCQARSGRS